VLMAPVIAQMSPASQGEGQLLTHPLIASPSKAHTVHRKQKEEELFVLKWEKDFQNKEEKVARPIVFQKVHCKLARFRFISEPSPHRKTMKLQHFLF